MKHSFLLLLAGITFLVMYSGCSLDSSSVSLPSLSGSDTTTVDNIKILYLKGTHKERGYQHGFYMGNRIMEFFDGFILGHMCKGNDSTYNYLRSFITKYFIFEQKYIDEAEGMLIGITEAGSLNKNSILNRTIDKTDVLVMSAIEENYNILGLTYGCSSISSWGESTKNDTLLKGDLIITRHWDYPRYESMIKGLLVVVHTPSEPNENKWSSVAWAGMIGSCSAMKIQGVGAFLDYGAFYLKEELPNLSKHRPVSLSIRNAIENKDYNSDGHESSKDVIYALNEFTPYFGSLIHVVSSTKYDSSSLIIESDNAKGVKIRYPKDNTKISGDNLALTNHFRILYDPAPGDRYNNLVDSLETSTQITFDRSWDLLAGATGAKQYNIISISYVPAQGIIRCSFTKEHNEIPAYKNPGGIFLMKDLFE